MFERFTDRARRVLTLAQEEARLMDHAFIGTEHILLGLIREGEGVAARALEELGISLPAARDQVEGIVGGPGGKASGSPPFTPRAKKVLELSLREALQLGHHYIGTEHLLLGLVREGEGVAVQVLLSLGTEPGRVRQKVIQVMSGTTVEPVRRGAKWLGRGGTRRRRGATYMPFPPSEVWQFVSDSCSLCGRDLWEVEHYIAADEVRVCDQCIGAAATVLGSAGSASRALALPPRVFGEAPDAESVDELVRAVVALVGPAEGRHRRRDVLEDAVALEAQLRSLDDRLTGTSRVSRIRFVAPDRADLRFHFRVISDDGELTAQGPAVRAEGRWMLTRVAVADALERAGVRPATSGAERDL